MKLIVNILLAFYLSCQVSFAQKKKIEWFLNSSVNLYIPDKNWSKATYPILGYNKNTTPKILLGGVGLGASLWMPLTDQLFVKANANISKITYWDEPIILRDYVGNEYGVYQSGSSDYILGIGGLINYSILDHLFIGTGIGAQALAISLSRLPEMVVNQQPTDSKVAVNKYYRRFLPVVPIEISYQLKKISLAARYDIGLANRLKGDLGKNKSEKFGLLTFDVGFKLR